MRRVRVVRVAVRVYGALLRLYPKEFREAYGAQMLQAFRDGCRDEADGLAALWVRSLFDVLKNACAERLEQMTTRRWWLRAINLSGSVIAYMVSWLGLMIALLVVTYFMLVPWDEGRVPTGTFAAAVNDFFESRFILLPLFIATGCEIIAISRLMRRRIHSFSRIYWQFAGVNVVVSAISLAVAELSKIVIGRIFPTPPVFEAGYGFSVDPNYGTAVVYCGLVVVGAILVFFVRLAWRTRDSLPLTRRGVMPPEAGSIRLGKDEAV